MTTTLEKKYSVAEYLDLEIQAETRNEYRNGEIIPMTGGTPTHNEIIGAITVVLRLALKGKPFQVLVTDQRLWIPDTQTYTYPDVMVLAKPIQLQEGRKDTVINPILIAEALSSSTQNYDRSEKFTDYRTIPSFQEYLLVDQTKFHVEQYIKQEANKWLMLEYRSSEDKFRLESIGVEVSLVDLYEDVEL